MAGSLPIGGTTGLSHEHSAAITLAAEWLATVPQSERPKPIVPALRERFGLSAVEACQAIREASDLTRNQPNRDFAIPVLAQSEDQISAVSAFGEVRQSA